MYLEKTFFFFKNGICCCSHSLFYLFNYVLGTPTITDAQFPSLFGIEEIVNRDGLALCCTGVIGQNHKKLSLLTNKDSTGYGFETPYFEQEIC